TAPGFWSDDRGGRKRRGKGNGGYILWKTGRLQQAPRVVIVGLLQVLADEFRHLEHRHLLLAAENLLERVVSVDHAPVLAVLQLLALDVGPELLGHLGARHGVVADHRAESGAGFHRFHECGTRLPLLRGHRRSLLSIGLGAMSPRGRVRLARECVNPREKSTFSVLYPSSLRGLSPFSGFRKR